MKLTELLKTELDKPLPGSKYQNLMLPEGRKNNDKPSSKNSMEAAVAIIISHASEPQITLIKRTEYNGHHSGQVSLPGGKTDSVDTDLMDTAIRECYEEIGLKLTPDDLLGKLSPLHIPVSSFLVYPFVFQYSGNINCNIDPTEVQYVIPCKLSDLIDKKIIKQTVLLINEYCIDTPYFDIGGEIVWGATSMILSEFREVLKRILLIDPNCLNPGLK